MWIIGLIKIVLHNYTQNSQTSGHLESGQFSVKQDKRKSNHDDKEVILE